MKKTIFFGLIGLVILFVVFACDSNDDDSSAFSDFIDDFSEELIDGLVYDDVGSIMQYYSEDYLNDGMTKDDMQSLFVDLVSDSVYVATDMVSNDDYKFSYQIITSFSDTTIVDYAEKDGNDFILIGNQN